MRQSLEKEVEAAGGDRAEPRAVMSARHAERHAAAGSWTMHRDDPEPDERGSERDVAKCPGDDF